MGMVVRKIVINLLAACLLPLIFISTDLYDAVTSPQRYQPEEFKIGMLVEYFYERHWGTFIRVAVFSLALIFLPLQLIKNLYLGSENKSLSFFKRWVVLSVIVSIWFFLGGGIAVFWLSPWYRIPLTIAFPFLLGLVFTTFFHYTLDRYERIRRPDQTKNDDVEINYQRK